MIDTVIGVTAIGIATITIAYEIIDSLVQTRKRSEFELHGPPGVAKYGTVRVNGSELGSDNRRADSGNCQSRENLETRKPQ
jgi:hypothetical protein